MIGIDRRRTGFRDWRTSLDLLAVACLALLATNPASAAYDPPVMQELDALRAASATPVLVTFERSFPRVLGFDIPVVGPTPVEQAWAFLADYEELYRQNDPALALALTGTWPDADFEVVGFHQTYEGLPVFGASLAIVIARAVPPGNPRIVVAYDFLPGPRVHPPVRQVVIFLDRVCQLLDRRRQQPRRPL